MPSDRVRVVLHESVVESNLIKIANDQNWWMHERHAREGEKPAEFIYMTRDRLNFIHWIEDHTLGVNYILVKGPETSQIVQTLRARLANFSPAYIVHHAREPGLPPEERRLALYHLALHKAEQGFDQETFDIYCEAMRDPDPHVRAAAVQGAAYLKWPELAEPLRARTGPEESEEIIRENAAGLIPHLDGPSRPDSN
jgi:hypothetical protein